MPRQGPDVMDPEFSRLRALFEQAIDLPPAERAEFLDRQCGGDTSLRERIWALIATAEQAGDFLGEVADETRESPDARLALLEGPGARIGPYKLLELIGEGGFGTVFHAEQLEPIRRRVALKIIKLGMDTRQVVARFEAERQALAMMDHPNIARVFDAGATETGRPYFVMELVRGEPITTWCDASKLPIRGRLELLQQVCSAVQHAHTKGIIHRDLKPSNILITIADGKPVPKVIDFGIAKATSARLTEKTLFTEHRALIGTPAYMSPEQAERSSVDVDTRSDIYSLGVLLYELLTGVPPFDPERLRSAAYAEIQRIIREEDPPRPSTRLSTIATAGEIAAHRATQPPRLNALIRGDLDWIIMKAMEKDRDRRYETATSLADDILRHLAGEPVLAAPPSAAYRTRKFVRRHRMGVAVAGFLVLAIVIASTGSVYGFLAARAGTRTAQAGERKAQQNAEVAQAINDFLTHDLLGAIIPEGERRPDRGRDVKLREVLDAAAANLDQAAAPGGRFADKPLVEAALRSSIGDAYMHLGETDRVEVHRRKALELHERERGGLHPDTIQARAAMAGVLLAQGDYSGSAELLERVVDQSRQVMGDEDLRVAEHRRSLGRVYTHLGRWDDAERHLIASVRVIEHRLGATHRRTLLSVNALAELYRQTNRFDQAEPLFLRVVDASRATLGEEHPYTLGVTSNLAALYFDQARYKEARPLMELMLEARRRVIGQEHPDTLDAMLNLANVLHALNLVDLAEQLERELLAIQTRTLGPDHPSTLISTMHLGQTLMARARYDEARDLLSRAHDALRRTLGEDHPHAILSADNLAQLYMKTGQFDQAEQLYLELIEICRRVHGPGHTGTIGARVNLAVTYALWERMEEAEALLREVLAIAPRALGMQHPFTRNCIRNLAKVLEKQGKLDESRAVLARLLDREATEPGGTEATRAESLP
jgi:eukaryotic-like serine/threonine-protein kinase